MKSILSLLRLHPLRALKEIIISKLKLKAVANTDWFLVDMVEGSPESSKAKVTLELNNLHVPPIISASVVDPVVIYIDKIPLSMLNLKGKVKLPLNRHSLNLPLYKLMEQKFIEHGFRFEENDFADNVVTVNTTAVDSGDGSARWYGNVDLEVVVSEEPISLYIDNCKLTLPFDTTNSLDTFTANLAQILTNVNSIRLPVPISPSDFIVNPSTLTRIGNDGEAINASITVEFVMEYDGNLEIHYGRRAFTNTYLNNVIVIDTVGMSNQDLVDLLNERLLSSFTLDEFIPFTLPTTSTVDDHKFYIRFKETSLVHTGEIWIDYTRSPV